MPLMTRLFVYCDEGDHGPCITQASTRKNSPKYPFSSYPSNLRRSATVGCSSVAICERSKMRAQHMVVDIVYMIHIRSLRSCHVLCNGVLRDVFNLNCVYWQTGHNIRGPSCRVCVPGRCMMTQSRTARQRAVVIALLLGLSSPSSSSLTCRQSGARSVQRARRGADFRRGLV